jgi:hypothetical protein
MHDPFDYEVGNTRIVCNPKGYPSERTRQSDSKRSGTHTPGPRSRLVGTKHATRPITPLGLVRKIKKDRAGTIREIVECLKNSESFVARNKLT